MKAPIVAFLQCLILAITVLMCAPECPALQMKKYDGHWWLLLTAEEKDGYLNGDSDCYVWEMKAKPRYSKSFVEERENVTNFYASNPDKRSLPVFEAIRIAEEQPPLGTPPSGGEVWTEPHGYWDGQWWREGTPVDRLGFVEGYMACYSKSPKPHGAFSKTPTEYVHLIDRWYKLDEGSGGVDPKRVDDKIADVLFKFHDR